MKHVLINTELWSNKYLTRFLHKKVQHASLIEDGLKGEDGEAHDWQTVHKWQSFVDKPSQYLKIARLPLLNDESKTNSISWLYLVIILIFLFFQLTHSLVSIVGSVCPKLKQ